MFNNLTKKAIPVTNINFQNVLAIKGYVPNPQEGRAYVIAVDKLNVANIVGLGNHLGIRVAIAAATVTNADMAKLVGNTVILVDKTLVTAAKNPFTRKEVLALIAAQNAVIYGSKYESLPLVHGADVEDMPDRVADLINGGAEFGWNATRRGLNRQNRLIDKGCRPIVHSMYKTTKKSNKAAKKADGDNEAPESPFASATEATA